ncbi:MAG: hypothetical protein H6739_39800 [Alphaproteobacteria bacterium]|nr:hypothetical protein [Alphaproteobacteria bacterium]
MTLALGLHLGLSFVFLGVLLWGGRALVDDDARPPERQERPPEKHPRRGGGLIMGG